MLRAVSDQFDGNIVRTSIHFKQKLLTPKTKETMGAKTEMHKKHI